jgi:hypothetical protein
VRPYVATVTLYGLDSEIQVTVDIDEGGKASLHSGPDHLDVDQLAAKLGVTRHDVMLMVEEEAARQLRRAPIDDEDPPSHRGDDR